MISLRLTNKGLTNYFIVLGERSLIRDVPKEMLDLPDYDKSTDSWIFNFTSEEQATMFQLMFPSLEYVKDDGE